jgi:hypothetical protein
MDNSLKFIVGRYFRPPKLVLSSNRSYIMYFIYFIHHITINTMIAKYTYTVYLFYNFSTDFFEISMILVYFYSTIL